MKRPHRRVPERRRETYFIAAMRGGKIHAIKIGLASRGGTATRLRNLSTGTTDTLKILHVHEGGSWERKFHRRFRKYKLKGEFYLPHPTLMKFIAQLAEAQRLIAALEALEASEAQPRKRSPRSPINTTYSVRGARR